MEENTEETVNKQIKFLRKELESQNLAILRLERAFESGEGLHPSEKQKSVLTLADMEFTLFGIEEKIKKHNELLKSIVISIVGLNDLLEEVRDFYKKAVIEIQSNQEKQMNSYQDILSGSVESLRNEFLIVLRDFREKYPKLEEISLHQSTSDPKPSPTRKLESTDTWSEEQLKDLNQRSEEMEILVHDTINEGLDAFNKKFNYLVSKIDELNFNIRDTKIRGISDKELT